LRLYLRKELTNEERDASDSVTEKLGKWILDRYPKEAKKKD